MNDLVLTDSSLRDYAVPLRKRLDMAFGVDENDFELTLPLGGGASVGDFIYFADTEWGGVIDRETLSHERGRLSTTYNGRTWHGVLACSVICPDSGKDYLAYSGDLHAIFRTIVQRQGLSGLFAVKDGNSGFTASGNFDRYTDAYTAFKKLCKSKGCKLRMRVNSARKVELSAVAVEPIRLDTDEYDLQITEGRYTNHLVCLGSGELSSRVVVDLYMDGSGNVSGKRTFSGVDEIASVYDYNNADSTELTEKGTEKLAAEFANACELTVADNLQLEIGDVVRAASVERGIEIEATVEKVLVVLENESASVSYEVGNITKRA